MPYRNSNYTAFYVDESQINKYTGAHFARDFCYYQLLKSWKREDGSFSFIDAHGKTYNVRDDSDWETTLKPRLHERLRMSKNIILILSDTTVQSKALKEEIEYGVDACGLPVIVAYPEMDFVGCGNQLSPRAIARWENLPCFKERVKNIPTAHVPFKKELIEKALPDPRFSVCSKSENCIVGLNTDYEYAIYKMGQQIDAQLEGGG